MIQIQQKKIIAQGREPTLSNVKLWEGKESMNIDIKKLDSDYMTQYQSGLTKVYEKIPKDYSCQLTRDKFELDDADLLIEQINPDLLNPFRENPVYTFISICYNGLNYYIFFFN